MENLGDRVLKKIKEEKIRPRPRWQFLLENYLIWLLFLISLVLGALAFCGGLHVFFANDWDLYRYLHTSLAGHILISIPYIWIGFLVLFVFIAFYNFRFTKSGYRQENYIAVGLSVLGSLLLGSFLLSLGIGEKIDELASERIPEYEKIVCCGNRKDLWVQPGSGLLAGKIIGTSDEENFELQDFSGFGWHVKKNDKTRQYNFLKIQPGEEVKIIGEEKGDYIFWAREIRPWKSKIIFFGGNNQ